MEITTTTIEQNPNRRAAVNALAVVGFIVLIAIGVALAIYSARYVPKAVSRIGSAAVSLSGIFHSGKEPAQLAIVSSSTLPIGGSAIIATSSSTTTIATTTTSHRTGTVADGTTTTRVVTTTQPAPLSGLADLTVTITNVGYLSNNSDTNSFVASTNVPSGDEGAVQFTVANNGTNATGTWQFTANVPTIPTFTYTSPTQPSMLPGDRIEYTLGFDRTSQGTGRVITINVDSNNNVTESNEGNNTASANVDIR